MYRIPNTDPLKQHTYLVEIDGIKVNAVVYQEQLDEIENSNGYEIAFDMVSKSL